MPTTPSRGGGGYSADTLYFTTEFSGDTELNTGRIYLGGTLMAKPSVWEELPEPPRPKHNEIWYTTTDGQKEDMYDLSVLGIGATYTGPELLSNEYKDGKGVMTFAEDVTWLGFDVEGGLHYGINFVNASSLGLPATRWETVTLPDTVTELRGCGIPGIGSVGVFLANESLKHVDCGSGTVANGYHAFASCTALSGVSVNLSETVTANCYSNMFYDCTILTTAPALPATALADYCYSNMFQFCTSLTTAPALPATELATNCYHYMFEGCTSLTTAPELPATELAVSCYYGMFEGCTSLATAPALPATALAANCYGYMFSHCTRLTTAPALPATTLAENCYQLMFQACTSLTTAPALSATTLANNCCYRMFADCTSLTTAPELPATALADYCYIDMFNSCTSLATAPALPATVLADYCYSNMFSGCTSLTTAPALPATELAESCYPNMFNGCTSLNSIEVSFTDWGSSIATGFWLDGVSSTGTFKCPSALPKTRGESYIPYGWTIVTK